MSFIKFIKNNGYILCKTLLILVFSLLLITAINNVLLRKQTLNKYVFSPAEFNEAKETEHKKKYENLFEELKKGAVKLGTSLNRDIFVQKEEIKKPDHPYKVGEIYFDPLAFMFMGTIEKEQGMFIAQINWNNKTSFVKEGDSLDAWTVVQIRRDEVSIINAKGEELKLPMRKNIYVNEPFAEIINTITGEKETVKKGDMLKEYKILDINKSTVILKINLDKIILKK